MKKQIKKSEVSTSKECFFKLLDRATQPLSQEEAQKRNLR